MSSLEERFRAGLLANSGLVAMLGARVYLGQLPQNPVFPALAYQRVSTMPLSTLDSSSAQYQSVGWARFQVTIWALGPTAGEMTDSLIRQVATALQSFDGWALPTSPPTFRAAPNRLLNRSMTIEPKTNPPLFKARGDFQIWYQEQ